jgi:hypothetical protein
MPLDLSLQIDRVEGITREVFQANYMQPQKPVVIKHFYGSDAPLYHKWTFEYFRNELGHIEVGVYDVEGEERKDDRSYKAPDAYMKFGEYLDLIEHGETTKRLFLFNIFKHKKDLKKDYRIPSLVDNVLGFLPFTFFGGKGSVTRIHQDMDMSNVFLTEVIGKKRVVLIDPKYSNLLYRYPFSTHTSVDVSNPDYERFPGLEYVKGYDIQLEAGDTLFMPSGWWHHVEYLSGAIGVSIRALSPSYATRLRGLYHVGLLTHVDDLMRKVLGPRWHQVKSNLADKRAQAAMESFQ